MIAVSKIGTIWYGYKYKSIQNWVVTLCSSFDVKNIFIYSSKNTQISYYEKENTFVLKLEK